MVASRSRFAYRLAAILAGGIVLRALLIALTPGEWADTSSIAFVGRAFVADPLHFYAQDLATGSYHGLTTYVWPYPPAFLPFTAVLHWLSDLFGASVNRLDRSLISVADLGLAWLLQWLLGRLGRSDSERLAAAALVALGPAFVAVSGVHGQIDALAWLPAAAAVGLWMLPAERRNPVLCGALIGLGVSLKTAPGLALLAIVPTTRDWRELGTLLGAAAGVVLVCLAPFLLHPSGLGAITDYRGFPGRAGLTVLLQPHLALNLMIGTNYDFTATTSFLLNHAALLLAPGVLAVMFVAWRRRLGPADTLVALCLVIYVFAPAVLPQYWLWIVPFLVLSGRLRAALAYQVALLPLLVATYGFLDEPNQPHRLLSRGTVLHGYIPWLAAVTFGLLVALVVMLRRAWLTRPAAPLPGWLSRAAAHPAVRAAMGRIAQAPRHYYALATLLVVGAGLRLWLMVADRPAFLGFPDAGAYIAAVHGPLFWNPYKPAGYPLMLRILAAVTPHLSAAILVQHVLGLAAAVLLYAAVARLVRSPWLALIPAAVVLLSGTEIYLEHSALSDGPFTFVIAAALWCASKTVPSVRDETATTAGWGRRTAAYLAAAGILLGVGTLLRPVGGALLPVFIIWALVRHWPGWRTRLLAGVVPALGAAVVLAPYLIAQHADTGSWGLTRATAEQFYGRVATFADCRKFTVPAGARPLCENSDPAARPNANWYLFDSASPLLRTFGTPPPGNPFDPNRADYRYPPERILAAFDRAALENQPVPFLLTTLEGMVKYVAPHLGPRSMLEWDSTTLVHELHNPAVEATADRYVVLAYQTAPGYIRHGLTALDAYASYARVEGLLTGILLLLMLVGFFLARGAARTAAGLFGWSTLLLALAPVALLFYSSRYATPMYGPLAAGAAIGADQLLQRSGEPGSRLAFLRRLHRPGRARRRAAEVVR